MSNYLAIATVTAALQRILQASVQRDVEGTRISTVAPHRVGQGIPETGINLFLYQVTRNNALKTSDAHALRSRNKQSPWRQSALELHYLLSFYGNEAELEPQRLLGSVVRTFNDRTTLSADLIQDTIQDATLTFLTPSDLSSHIQEMQIAPEDLTLEDLSKIWSVFFQTPYALSLAYKVMAVVIDGEDPAQRALPVRDRPIAGIAPFPTQPHIDRILNQAGATQPILPDSTLLIQGRNLQGLQTQVWLGGMAIAVNQVSDTELVLPLSSVPLEALRAGVQSLQVLHSTAGSIALLNAGAPQPRILSNAAPFVLSPLLKSVQVNELDVQDEDQCSAELQVQVTPFIHPTQSVLLSLYEWSVQQPATYLLEVPPRTQALGTLTIPIRQIKPGEYLVRLMVDGAESPLGIDRDPDSSTFNWYDRPRINLQN